MAARRVYTAEEVAELFFKTVVQNLVAMQVVVILKMYRLTVVIPKQVCRLTVIPIDLNQSMLLLLFLL